MSRNNWWQKYVPGYARNPFRLAWQLLREKNPAARSAMYMAAMGVAAAPLDLLFANKERRIYERAPDPEYPIILVCGPPRSGTTLVAQYLINNLDVSYLNNLTSLFPRSPIYANRLLGRFIRPGSGDYSAFYGKSRGLSGANDALYIWDRWLGGDRSAVPKVLSDASGPAMRRFFGAVENLSERPLVNKVNRLNTCAHLVAAELPTARFICVMRDPLYLAQSLYIARNKIMGDPNSAYGVQHQPTSDDPVEDVCLQVVFHQQEVRRQQELLGEDRFMVLPYEDFCRRPAAFLTSYAAVAGLQKGSENHSGPQEFAVSKSTRLPDEAMSRIRTRLNELGAFEIKDPKSA